MENILIIEDDAIIRDELSAVLKNHRYGAVTAMHWPEIEALLRTQEIHLILLDINLPEEDGFLLCTKIRSVSKVPIIFVTSRASEWDELQGITLGGDDYITKPYNIPVLLARIASLLRRAYPKEPTNEISVGELTLLLDTCRVIHQGKMIELTKTEYKIFFYLLTNPDKIIPRAELVDFLWDNQIYIDDNALSVHVSRIRNKLAEIGAHDIIKTKHRQGYAL